MKRTATAPKPNSFLFLIFRSMQRDCARRGMRKWQKGATLADNSRRPHMCPVGDNLARTDIREDPPRRVALCTGATTGRPRRSADASRDRGTMRWRQSSTLPKCAQVVATPVFLFTHREEALRNLLIHLETAPQRVP